MSRRFQLSDWAQIAEILGAVAVVASLIFVGLEVRHATEQLRLASDVNSDLNNAQLSIHIASNEDLSKLILKAEVDPESLSELELARFINLALPRLALWENTYDGYVVGNMTDSDWREWDIFYRLRWDKPGYEYVYRQFRIGFGKDGQEYFDALWDIDE